MKNLMTILKPILFAVELDHSKNWFRKNIKRLPFDRSWVVLTYPDGKDTDPEIPYIGGEKYVLVKNAEVLTPLMDVLSKNPKFKNLQVRLSNVNNEIFTVDFFNIAPDKRKNDYIAPVIRFVNSYNGKVQAQASAALYRIDKEGKETFLNNGSIAYKFKHHSDEGAIRISEISENVDLMLSDFSTISEQVEMLKKIEIESGNITKTMEAIVPDAKKFPKKSIPLAVELIGYESNLFGTTPNLWLVYTALAQAVKKSDSAMDDHQKEIADSVAWENVLNFADGQKKKKK